MAEGLGRKCIFCEGEPVSREHLWPQWLAEVVPADAAIECSHTWQRGTSEPTEFAQRPFQLTVRAVCENCNGGWMSVIENEAKHLASGMIQGRARAWRASGGARGSRKSGRRDLAPARLGREPGEAERARRLNLPHLPGSAVKASMDTPDSRRYLLARRSTYSPLAIDNLRFGLRSAWRRISAIVSMQSAAFATVSENLVTS